MKYKRDKDVVKREIAGELFLIPVRKRLADMSSLYVLHGIGEFIWDRLDEDTETICGKIVDEYQVDSATARKDMEEYLQKLLTANLITAEA